MLTTIDGFDYVAYLKKHLMVGQIDPWRSTDEGKKLYTLLVSVEIAMEECQAWSNQEFSRHDFVNYLKTNDVLVFKNVEDFVKTKEEAKEEQIIFKKGFKKKITEERREQLRKQVVLMNEAKKASIL